MFKLGRSLPKQPYSFSAGVTFIELLLVIALIAVVGSTTIPIGSAFLVRVNSDNKDNQLISSLRTAQINSINGKEDRQWGVQVTASEIILYADGDTSFNQSFPIPASITITQDTVLFDLLTGNPDGTPSFTITTNTGDTTTISVNEVGTVDVN